MILLLLSGLHSFPDTSEAAPSANGGVLHGRDERVKRVRVGVSGRGKVKPSGGKFAVGKPQTFTAIPADGFVFRNWTDAAGAPLAFDSDQPTLHYIVSDDREVRANFVRNPFRRFAGTVNAWLRAFDFSATGIPTATSRGLATISLTKTGAFSGRLNFDGETLRLKGALNGFGNAHLRLARGDASVLRVGLSLQVGDPAGPLAVTVVGGEFCAMGSVGTSAPPVLSRRYSVAFAPQVIVGATSFFGNGYATLRRDRSGAYRGVGALEDGLKISFSGRIVRDHFEGVLALPIYTGLSDGGLLSGLLAFQDASRPSDDIVGSVQRLDAAGAARIASSAPRASVPQAAQTVYVAPDGSDANNGSRAAPLETLQVALAKIGGEGEIVMLAGDYEGAKVNLATARKVTIRSESGNGVKVFLGEKVMGGSFTHYYGNMWTAPVRTVVPAQGDQNRYWIFEMGTPEGAIPEAARRPQQRGRNHRLDHFRLGQAASIASVDYANGRYFISDGMLYLRTSNGEPPAPDQEFRIPSQTAGESFVFGATAQCDITLEGIEIYCGVNDVDLSGAAAYRVAGCKFFGAGNSGILAVNVPVGIEEGCEYAANANDGSSPVNGAPTVEQITVIDAWSHDNGDEGHSIHQNCRGTYLGGLYEYNANGGITPAIGGSAVILGTYTRGNVSGITPAVIPDVNVLVSGWTSDRDFDGFEQWTGGLITIVDSKILNSLHYASVGIVSNARAHLFNTQTVGSWGNGAGAGGPNFTFTQGRAAAEWAAGDSGATVFDVQGSRYSAPIGKLRIEPFGFHSPNGLIEILRLNAFGEPVALLSEDFTLAARNVVTIPGANPQRLSFAIDLRPASSAEPIGNRRTRM